jgi:hypothetical protein
MPQVEKALIYNPRWLSSGKTVSSNGRPCYKQVYLCEFQILYFSSLLAGSITGFFSDIC